MYKKIIRTRDGFRVVHINRRRACRFMCKECVGWEHEDEITKCTGEFLDGSFCHLHPFRQMRSEQKPSQRNKAIRMACLYCMGGHIKLVKNCVSIFCPLHPYRNTTIDKTSLYDGGLSDNEILRLGVPCD